MNPDDLSRRDFAAALALFAAGPALPAAEPGASQAELLLALVKAKYGKHLDDDQLKLLAGRLRGLLATAEKMAKTPLANGDEPAVVVHPEGRARGCEEVAHARRLAIRT